MATYTAKINWALLTSDNFIDSHYSRKHTWSFDGGQIIQASASPNVVPLPYSTPSAIDPEEAFIASIASCHMLWFLHVAAKKKCIVQSYTDIAAGKLSPNHQNELAMTTVTLSPKVIFDTPSNLDTNKVSAMHHEAHEQCFIANSVTTNIVINPQF